MAWLRSLRGSVPRDAAHAANPDRPVDEISGGPCDEPATLDLRYEPDPQLTHAVLDVEGREECSAYEPVDEPDAVHVTGIAGMVVG